jgi:hypothetical protein
MFPVVAITNRQGTTTEGDTSVVQTLPLVGPLQFLFWEMEAWLIFDPASGLKPLSMGRFDIDISPNDGDGAPGGMVDGTGFDQSNPYTLPYTLEDGFDSNFAFPGEDFLSDSLLAHGITPPLNVIEDERAIKIWLTLEPANRFWVAETRDPMTGLIISDGFFQEINLDWAPEDPFSQLIVFSAWLPTFEVFEPHGDTLAPATRPMVYRDLNPNLDPLTSLNEGHRWPQMTVFVGNSGP